jgi:hypothetical protein
MHLTDVTAASARPTVTWQGLKWIREVWTASLWLKGILIGDDASRAIDHGAAAVVVSNRGGRHREGTGRGSNGWRHSPRQRYRKGHLVFELRQYSLGVLMDSQPQKSRYHSSNTDFDK